MNPDYETVELLKQVNEKLDKLIGMLAGRPVLEFTHTPIDPVIPKKPSYKAKSK